MSGAAPWLSTRARALAPSRILAIAAEVAAKRKAGRPVINLSLGDFDAAAFPIPGELAEAIAAAIAAGATTYPPLEGIRELREVLVAHAEKTQGLRVPVESVLVASGARPVLFAAYAALLDPGDVVVYGSPSWANEDFCALVSATARIARTSPERGFLPSADEIAPLLAGARLLCLNTPINPAGAAMDAASLRAILELVLAENTARSRSGAAPLHVLFDQVYGELAFEGVAHVHPAVVVPEAAPWIVTVDAVSKSLAATGLRVGWAFVPPLLFAAMRDIVCHTGGWAPTPVQVAIARFLASPAGVRHRDRVRGELSRRARALAAGLARLEAAGAPVAHIAPQGGLYVAARLDWKGRRHRGARIAGDEATRRLLLDEANVAVVPFDAFEDREDSGWFRLSVGAADVDTLERACAEIARVITELE